MKTQRSWIAALLVGALITATALGCNTFRGAGKDIQRGGSGIEHAAEGVQNK